MNFPERVWALLACFRSVQLAIVLLALLALATMAGVLLPQEGLVDTIEIKKQYGTSYRTLKAMGLFNVYSSYWFIALEVLFFFSLLFGSFQWLKPAFLAATRKTFCGPEHIQASPHRLAFTTSESLDQATDTVTRLLKQARYRIQEAPGKQPGQRLLYASKGNFSRLGPVMAHTGILLTLLASVYGAFYGFTAQQLASPGETFSIHDAQMFKPHIDPTVWQGRIPEWKIRVNQFHIDYYPEDETPPGNAVVKQYYADLSIVDLDGNELKRDTISVNHPLNMGSTTIYQASFSPTGKFFVEIDGEPHTLEANTEFMDRTVSFTELDNGQALMAFPFFAQQDPGVTRNYMVFFLRDANGFVGAQPGQMPPNLRLMEGESGTLHGLRLKFERPEISTGLQIKEGPEVPAMYLAYLIIIVGTIMCIFSQRRLWLAITVPADGQPTQVLMLYKTNKARLSFMKELKRLQLALFQRWPENQPQPDPAASASPSHSGTPMQVAEIQP